MMIFYNIAIRLYGLGIRVASFFNPKAKTWLEGREGLLERIESQTASYSGETLWVHCASLGEFEMVRPLVEQLRKAESSLRVVITFFSPSGYEVRNDYEGADHVFYLPLDTPSNAIRFVNAVKPSKVIFVKYDLWFHHLKTAKDFGAILILVSASFSQDQMYFRFSGGIGRRLLGMFHQIFLVDDASKRLLDVIGVDNAIVNGDTRYDSVMKTVATARRNEVIESFKGESMLIICGSTWQEDEEVLQEAVENLEKVKWVIAPHEVGERSIRRLQKLFPDSTCYSKFENMGSNVLIIDSIGLLSESYQYADVAYIGGGFRTGLHNIFEAAAFGVPTVFGPDTSRFPDAMEMVQKGLAFRIRNESELRSQLSELLALEQDNLRDEIQRFMDFRTGATEAILEYTKNC